MIRFKIYKIGWIVVLWAICPVIGQGQNDSTRQEKIKNIVTVEESLHKTRVTFPGGNVEVDEMNDTITRITIGRRRFDIIENPGVHTRIQMVRKPLEAFKGHWAGFDLGLSNFFSTPFDSYLPPDDRWMDLNSGKSASVGINLFQHSIGLQQYRRNLGFVTGAGWTINNYRLDSRNILRRGDDGQTTYEATDRSVDKNKLVTSFLTVPVLLEWQPGPKGEEKDFFINGGFYGSFRLGSHTKVIFHDGGGKEKEKWREDLNINAFKYGAMVRTGYKWIRLYAKCDLTPLFEKGRGPELYPWTVGLTLVPF
ncbi:MAG: outer membrane beta-barrel protein [Marinilabiliaceae bacterium]